MIIALAIKVLILPSFSLQDAIKILGLRQSHEIVTIMNSLSSILPSPLHVLILLAFRLATQVRLSRVGGGIQLQGPRPHLLRVGMGVGAAPRQLPPDHHFLPRSHSPPARPSPLLGAARHTPSLCRLPALAPACGSAVAGAAAAATRGRGQTSEARG